jgi:uncharacterized membrane protein
MNRFARLMRHRRLDETDARRALDPAALERLRARVAASEQHHSGEIRICVETGLPLSYLWRGASARERAVAMFGKLRVWDTEHNNGVLIYLLLAERRIEIIADRGIDRHVGAERWRTILDGMRDAFRERRFEAGLDAAIDAVDALLVRYFPLERGAANPNELPDAVVLR